MQELTKTPNWKRPDNYSSGSEKLVVEIDGYRFSDGVLHGKPISLARELPYTLFVNDREILSISTLPTNLKELFVGFLIAEGVLVHKSELIEIHVDDPGRLVRIYVDAPDERLGIVQKKGMLTSGCAGGMVFSVQSGLRQGYRHGTPTQIKVSSVLARMKELDTFTGIYTVTKGVHAASVADNKSTIMIQEDLGRHNAVDKIAGWCFLNDLANADKMVLTTGRITSEVLIKASRSSFPIIISRSSASSMAVNMAQQSGIDVITYVRAGRFNYFSNGGVQLINDIQKSDPPKPHGNPPGTADNSTESSW